MNALAEQQRALLEALWAPSAHQAQAVLGMAAERTPGLLRGLRAYRTNGRELAGRALAAAYPRVAQRLGEDDFAGLARHLWVQDPPQCGDMAQWGQGLPEAIESIAALVADHPDLPDLARVEWLLHRCATAPDVPQDAASLERLTQHPPEGLRLRLAPGTAVVGATLLWRDGLRPSARAALAGEPALVAATLRGAHLADALRAAVGLDFAAWLAEAWRTRLLTGVALHSSTGDCP